MKVSGLRKGEPIQIDGSDHHWFEGRGERCTLLVYVDGQDLADLQSSHDDACP